MSKTNESLSEALGIDNAIEIIPPSKPPAVVEEEKTYSNPDADADYDLSRKTFRDLIGKGNDAMESLTDLARESESPRAYEVLANMMRTIADTTKDLYDLQKKAKELKVTSEPGKKVLDNGSVNIDKAVFVGTTTELLKSLKENDKNGS
jgi:hypothetical protein